MYEKYARIRDENKKSDYQVSLETGLSRSILSEWKNGKHTPGLKTLRTLAEYFKVSIDFFLKEEVKA